MRQWTQCNLQIKSLYFFSKVMKPIQSIPNWILQPIHPVSTQGDRMLATGLLCTTTVNKSSWNMLDFSRYFAFKHFILVKSYNSTAEYFSCSAVAYKLIQKAKSTSKELKGSLENVEQVSGTACHNLHRTFCSTHTIPPAALPMLQTCFTFKENSRRCHMQIQQWQ